MGPGGLDLPDIIAAAAAAATTQGYATAAAAAAAAASSSVAATAPAARVLSPMKLLHLHFICRVSTNAEITRIWLEVFRAPTKAAALEVLYQYLWAGRKVFRRDFFGSADMLHVCGYLFMFVHGDWFVNPRNDSTCPAGGMSFWTTRQEGGDVGENIFTTEGTITAMDGANVRHEEVTTAKRTKLAVVVGLLMTAT